MNKLSLPLCALALALAAGGCDKPAEPEALEPVAETEEVVEPEELEVEDVDEEEVVEVEDSDGLTADTLPIPEDFVEEAETQITEDNYAEQLATMEQELKAP